jgi:hypothetical protein
MRSITYAGENLLTTDAVAAALVDLTAALAKVGQAEAVTIPIVLDDDSTGEAELVIGVGNDVLSVPVDWGDEPEPDFSRWEEGLRRHPALPQPVSNVTPFPTKQEDYDPDLDIPEA